MVVKRLGAREIKSRFKKLGAKLSPKQREEWEEKHTDQGLFDLREQTAPASQSLPASLLSLVFFMTVQGGIMHCLVLPLRGG